MLAFFVVEPYDFLQLSIGLPLVEAVSVESD